MPKRSRSRSAVLRRFKRARSVGRVVSKRGRMTYSKVRKNFSLNTHRFSRFTAAQTLDCTGTEQPLSFEFMFNQMYTYSEFTSLFDKYRLDKAVVYIQMINNPDGSMNTNVSNTYNAQNWYPKLWYISDHDDSNTTTIAAIKERVGVKCCVLKPNVVKKITVKPACAVQIYKTSVAAGYGPRWGQFIDMANPDVPHYGLKTVVDLLGLDPVGTYSFRYEYKLFFTCKDVQ